MGEDRSNGVDGAIRLLVALADCGVGATGVLAMRAALPRASFHRIARMLEAAGIVSRLRGVVAVGPIAKTIIETHRRTVAEEGAASALRLPVLSRPRVARTEPPLYRLTAPIRIGSGKRMRIGFSNASMDNPWRVALVHGVETAAANLGERVDWLSIRQAGDDAAQQARDIEDLLAAGASGLIVSAVGPGVARVVAKAKRAGVPVVTVDRGLGPAGTQTSFVTTDDAAIGSTTALWLAEMLKGEGRVLLLPGHRRAEPARARLKAAREVFLRFPQIEVLAVHWTGWRREEGRKCASEAIARWGRDIAGVWCDSGLQGVGSLQAFIAAGYPPGEIPPHTGGDLNVAYKLAIRHRVPLAAVDYPPAMGMRAVEVLYAAFSGRFVPSHVEVPLEVTLTRGHATRSVKPNLFAEEHVRWDLPDDLILSSGLGPAYNPHSFRIHYPGNRYNRSAGGPAATLR